MEYYQYVPNIKASLLPTSTSATGLVPNKIRFSIGKWHERNHTVDRHLPNTL
jgi:hypothetical protein